MPPIDDANNTVHIPDFADDAEELALEPFEFPAPLPYDATESGKRFAVSDTLIIPGARKLPTSRVRVPRRSRPVGWQMLVATILALILVSTLVVAVPLRGDVTDITSTFTTLANAINLSQSAQSIHYRAHPGDTFDIIANKFNVTLGGIFLLNHLDALAEAQVGQDYLIPGDPNYGSDYTPPLPAWMNPCHNGLPDFNKTLVSGFEFCAMAGKTNGPKGLCAPNYTSGDPNQYDLAAPEDAPNSHVSQNFWFGHSGLDVSTGTVGTPLHAAQDGTVIFAGWDRGGGGYSLKINLCGGLAVSYSHMVPGSLRFNIGDNVHKDDIVGLQGQSGVSFGPHVHYMLWWQNIPFDPLCVYGTLYGHSVASHYGGCPPSGMDPHSRWWH